MSSTNIPFRNKNVRDLIVIDYRDNHAFIAHSIGENVVVVKKKGWLLSRIIDPWVVFGLPDGTKRGIQSVQHMWTIAVQAGEPSSKMQWNAATKSQSKSRRRVSAAAVTSR